MRIDAASVEAWCAEYGTCGVGLRTGSVVAVDIDCLDDDLAWQIEQVARNVLGDTPLLRVGLWPKRLLVYRTDEPFPKIKLGSVEVLGLGQQFVGFGHHPDTGRNYYWPSGETPLDIPAGDLPSVSEDQCRDLLVRIAPLFPSSATECKRPRESRGVHSVGPVRDQSGLVFDGRDGWLSGIAFHVVHDALATGTPLELDTLAEAVWRRFEASTDLTRPASGTGGPYMRSDAIRKVRDKLRLHGEGRLPERCREAVEARYACPDLDAAEARARLDEVLRTYCADVLDWRSGPAPRLGIRATVGFGKSTSMRRHVAELIRALKAEGCPHRVLIATPSHELAAEAAAVWAGQGLRVAVHAGYLSKDRDAHTERWEVACVECEEPVEQTGLKNRRSLD